MIDTRQPTDKGEGRLKATPDQGAESPPRRLTAPGQVYQDTEFSVRCVRRRRSDIRCGERGLRAGAGVRSGMAALAFRRGAG